MDLFCKVMSLLFNMQSRLVITFLPRSKCLLISWLHAPSTLILEPPKIGASTIWWMLPSILRISKVTSLAKVIYNLRLSRWLSGKEPTYQCRRLRLDPWVEKIPWRRKWQPTPVFLPGESHGQRNLVGYSPRGQKESDMTEHTYTVCSPKSVGVTHK